MDILQIEASKSSPAIHFDPATNLLKITGESYPENTAAFYQSVFDWLENYFNIEEKRNIRLDIKLAYFNSSSSKVLSDMFELLEDNLEREESIEINWLYHQENDMSLEYGEEFQEDFEKLHFNLIAYDD